MPDVDAFAVADLVMLTGEVAEGRSVFDAHRDGGWQSTTGLGVAAQYLGHGGSHFLATEPHLHHGGDRLDPLHVDGSSGVHEDDRARIGSSHAANQFDLTTGQVE